MTTSSWVTASSEPQEHRAVDGQTVPGGPADPRRARPGALLRRVVRVVLTVALVAGLLVAYGLVDNRWYKVLAVEGNSMAPAIWAGDAIVITRPPEVIEPGMVLTVEVDGSVVTHRVVDVGPDGDLLLKGDANSAADDFSGNEVHVVGLVRLRVPGLGSLLSAATGLLGDVAPLAGPHVAPVSTAAWFSATQRTGDSTATAASWGSTAATTSTLETTTDDAAAPAETSTDATSGPESSAEEPTASSESLADDTAGPTRSPAEELAPEADSADSPSEDALTDTGDPDRTADDDLRAAAPDEVADDEPDGDGSD